MKTFFGFEILTRYYRFRIKTYIEPIHMLASFNREIIQFDEMDIESKRTNRDKTYKKLKLTK